MSSTDEAEALLSCTAADWAILSNFSGGNTQWSDTVRLDNTFLNGSPDLVDGERDKEERRKSSVTPFEGKSL